MPRVPWLDGVRALAALYVVVHHAWLTVFPDPLHNRGPLWVGWLMYGQLAVAVFIVVSGFSLGLAPVHEGLRLRGGARRFVRRRAWRILPAYWAALALSAVVAMLFLGTRTGVHITARGMVVHALLLQDLVHGATPNGVFWSIAVEWQIYFLFPLVLLVARRFSLPAAAGAAAGAVVAVHWASSTVPALHRVDNVTPQFFALFCFGVLAAGATRQPLRPAHRRGVVGLTVGGTAALVAYVVAAGPPAVVRNYFTIDLLLGALVAASFALVASGGAA